MFKRIYLLVILFGSSLFYGCEDMIRIDPPLDQVVAEDVFKSDVTAKAALSGLYSSFSQSQTQLQQLTIAAGLAADELRYFRAVTGTSEVAANTYNSTNTTVYSLFQDFYGAIYKANSVIEGAAAGSITPALKVRLTAEAKFLRAYCYFYLVTLFDGVPLVLQTDVNATAMLPRNTTADVYTQIVKDLLEARADLPHDYANSGGFRYGANYYAATALLARVYLFTGQYALAESSAGEVIAKSDLYTLIPSANLANGVFAQNNSEAIFQFMAWLTSTNRYTSEGSAFVPSATATAVSYGITTTLVNAFEPGDLRRTAWIKDVTFSGVAYYVPYKYKNTTSITTVTAGEYPTVLRLAEQYLIRAEARARIGSDVNGALADLNVIRTRAGLTESTTSDATALISAILEEKRKELFLELGHRWIDLRRSGTIDAVMNNAKNTWVTTAALFPIPQAAVDANPNLLPNNPGY